MSFHVGSQCMHPISYSKGITEIGNIIKKQKLYPIILMLEVDFLQYILILIPQSLDNYFDEIKKKFRKFKYK